MNKRIQTTEQPVIYIHTGGAGIVGEDVRDRKGSTKVYNDLHPDQINGMANEKIFFKINLLIINAAQTNPQLKSVIVLPPLVYGIGTGLFNRISVQLPALVRAALQRGKAVMIGPGDATWNTVHIADLVYGYILLLNQLLAVYGPDVKSDAKPSSYLTTGCDGYYFAENGQISWRQLSENIGQVLHKKGLIQSPKVTSFPDGRVESALIGPLSWFILGSQTCCKADRLRKLGWESYRLGLLDIFEEEVNAVIDHKSD